MALPPVSGALIAMGFPRTGWWPLVVPGLAILLGLVATAGARRAFLEAFVAGTVFFALLLQWFAAPILHFSPLGGWVAAGAVTAGALILGAQLGVLGAVASRLAPRLGRAGAVWSMAVLFAGFELSRGWFPVPFPWGVLSASVARIGVATDLARVAGATGVSLALASAAACLASLVLGGRNAPRVTLAWASIVLALTTLGYLTRPSTEAGNVRRVAVVQGSLSRETIAADELREYAHLTREAVERGAQIVVWPESATSFDVDDDSGFRELVERRAAAWNVDLVLGSVTGRTGRDVYNSAALVRADRGLVSVSHKTVLVPFGEYVPFRTVLRGMSGMAAQGRDFTAGNDVIVHEGRQARIGALICYEAIFPGISRQLTRRGATVLVNMTNDSWFGFSSGPQQHLAHGILRAAETGRPLLRAANSGVSAIVDRTGRVVRELGLGQRGVLVADVAVGGGRATGCAVGPVLDVLCATLAAALVFTAFWPRRPSRSDGGIPE